MPILRCLTFVFAAVIGALLLASPAGAAVPTVTPVKRLSIAEGNAGTKTARLTVSLSARPRTRVRVRFRTAAVTASAADFASRSGTLTFRRGIRRASIALSVKGDTLDEPNETFTVRLSRPSGARLGTRRVVTVTIIDDDVPLPAVPPLPSVTPVPPDPGPTPVVSVPDRTVVEPAAAGEVASHGATAQLNKATTTAVTVDYEFIAIGTTTTADDVDLSKGTLTFAPGETAKVIPGSVRGDALDENEERARIVLSNAKGADIISPDAFLTIDDDAADLPPSLSVGDITSSETGAPVIQVPVTLSQASGRMVSVAYQTQAGTAVSTGVADFQSASGTLIVQPGQAVATIPVALNDDPRDEPDQTFKVVISVPGNASIADAEGQVTITDNDSPPTISINDVMATEGTNAQFAVTLSEVSEYEVRARVQSVDGSAMGGTCGGGDDFPSLDAPVVYPSGIVSRTIGLIICSGDAQESTQTATVSVVNIVNAMPGDTFGTLTIIDPP